MAAIVQNLANACGALLFMLLAAQSAARADPLPDTLRKIRPGIVAVGTFMPGRAPAASFLGTGFAVGDGSAIATNAHVLPASLDAAHLERLSVFQRSGNKLKRFDATIHAVDEDHDVALLKLGNGVLRPLALADGRPVREGETYAFTGFPIGMVLGLFPVTHQGIVSAISPVAIPAARAGYLNSATMKRLRNPYDVYQLDATAYPGNSGSPLFDIAGGEVVGIINKVFVKESKENLLAKPSGITYAIPVAHLRALLATPLR